MSGKLTNVSSPQSSGGGESATGVRHNPGGDGRPTSGPRRGMRRRTEGRRICKCECGGIVRGVENFGRLFTWCESCTPVVKIDIAALERGNQQSGSK